MGLLIFNSLSAQDSTLTHVPKKKELIVGLGSMKYRGDLGSGYSSGDLSISLGIKLNTEKRLHGNFWITIGRLSGNELDYSYERDVLATPNQSFSSTIVAINYAAQYNMIDRPKFKIFISQGIGLLRYYPVDESGNSFSNVPESRNAGEDYSTISLFLPTQIGARYQLDKVSLGVQMGILNPTTDYIDNIGELGNNQGNDNAFIVQGVVYLPVGF